LPPVGFLKLLHRKFIQLRDVDQGKKDTIIRPTPQSRAFRKKILMPLLLEPFRLFGCRIQAGDRLQRAPLGPVLNDATDKVIEAIVPVYRNRVQVGKLP